MSETATQYDSEKFLVIVAESIKRYGFEAA